MGQGGVFRTLKQGNLKVIVKHWKSKCQGDRLSPIDIQAIIELAPRRSESV